MGTYAQIEEPASSPPPLSISPPQRVNRNSAIPAILGPAMIAEILGHKRRVHDESLASIQRGIADVEAGRVVSNFFVFFPNAP
jgi:hypothetical protein